MKSYILKVAKVPVIQVALVFFFLFFLIESVIINNMKCLDMTL